MNKKYFGIVEGFFSEPLKTWTAKERKKTIEFVGQYAPFINAYVYCPKDDPYVTDNWELLYPQPKQIMFKKLIQKLSCNGKTFVYGLNPNIKENMDWNMVRKKTIKKLNSIVALGCKNIFLLFDDIPLAYDVIDSTLVANVLYEDFVNYINDIYRYYEKSVDDFWVCLPDYTFIKETPLTLAAKKLNKNIGIIWTGNKIFSKTITDKDIVRVRQILFPQVRLIFWSNYPVNDCEQAIGTFNLGGFYPIKQGTFKKLTGIIVNPMREAYANLPFYITFADYIQQKQKYRRIASWENALDRLGLPSQSIKILSIFSSAKTVENKKIDIRLSSFIESKKLQKKFRNTWGKMFVQSIQSIFRDAAIFAFLFKDISENRTINIQQFEIFDWFPTKTYIARYCSEVLSIVKKRYALYRKYLPQQDPFIKQANIIEATFKKYSGQKKLTISKKDSALLLQNETSIILKEKKLFLSILQNKNLPVEEKIKLLYKRRNTNRFTIDK